MPYNRKGPFVNGQAPAINDTVLNHFEDSFEELYKNQEEPLYQTILANSSIFSLPSETIKGQVNAVYGGRTYTNLLGDDGDAENLTNWNSSGGTIELDNTRKVFGNSSIKHTTNISSGSSQIRSKAISIDNSKYYFCSGYLYAENSSNDKYLRILDVDALNQIKTSSSTTTTGKWERFGLILTPADLTNVNNIRLDSIQTITSTGQILNADAFMINEITQDEYNNLTVDELLEKYPYVSGTKSTFNTRLKSAGKNLFDGELELGEIYDTDGSNKLSTAGVRSKNYIRVNSNSNYKISLNGVAKNANIYWYDINKNYIGKDTVGSLISTPSNCGYVKFWYGGTSSNLSDLIQIEKGTTATTYEEYQESIQYIQLPQEIIDGGGLHSLPNNVKDEFNLQSGEHIQRVGEYIIKDSDVTNMRTDWANVDYILIPNYENVLGVKIDGVLRLLNRSHVTYSSSTTNTNAIMVNGAGSIYITYPKGALLTNAQTELINQALNYQLKPEAVKKYDIFTTPLEVFPNGTVLVENAVGEVSFYDSTNGVSVSNTGLPIESIDVIYKVDMATGTRTPIDKSQATISGDRLSWTHPDLTTGDLIDWDYYYPTELSTTPETSVTVATNMKAAVNNVIDATSQNAKNIRELQKLINAVKDKIDSYSLYRSGKDTNGIFTILEYKRPDSTLALKSTLSGTPDSYGNYPTRTEEYYAEDGTTVIATVTYSLSYDADGDLSSEVIE